MLYYRHSRSENVFRSAQAIKMQRPYNERWERTKRYLFRNLLVDPGFCLSPVPEESRSDSSDERPYSPLPELIIEREPNRHDESQEFYQGLEVRMRRCYRRLFLDGASEADSVEHEGLINIDEDISEFDVNQSMASTFVIDNNNRKDNEANKSTSCKNRANSENKKMSDDALLGTHVLSKTIQTSIMDTWKLDEYETNVVVNTGEDKMVSNEGIHKTVETESDSTHDDHRTSITVAQIHEKRKRSGPITRVFEGGSPVLIPRLHKFSRQIFGALSANITNFIGFANNDIVQGNNQEDIHDIQIFDKPRDKEQSLNQAVEQKHCETNIDNLNLDLEVENLMKNTEAVSNATHDSIQANKVEKYSEKSGGYKSSYEDEEELVVFDEEPHTTTISSAETKSESDEGRASKDDESIGPNEYDYTQANRTDTSVTDEDDIVEVIDNSFEMAVRKGIFEGINKRKAFSQSSDEELATSSKSDNEECEPIEVMRGTAQTELFEAFRRKSTESQESPIVGVFAIPTTAELDEDNSFHDEGQLNASNQIMKETRKEMLSLRNESTLQKSNIFSSITQTPSDNLDLTEDLKNISKATLKIGKIKESSIETDEAAPTIPANNLMTSLCRDTWSVSPIEINVADLSPIDQNMVASCRRKELNTDKTDAEAVIDLEAPEIKRKKYKHIEIQTSASVESCQGWEDIKDDFFVGTPLVFNLCCCQNHICP